MFDNCLFLNVRKLERKLSLILDEEFNKIDLHPTYAYILTLVSQQEYTKVKHISCTLGLESSTVTRMVSKLQCDGFVKKGSAFSPCDISLTQKGKEIIPDLEKCFENFNSYVNSSLGEESRNCLNNDIINFISKL